MATQCLNCGTPFVNARADKRFCNSTCRGQYDRKNADDDLLKTVIQNQSPVVFPDAAQSAWEDKQREKIFEAEKALQAMKKEVLDLSNQYGTFMRNAAPHYEEIKKGASQISALQKILLKDDPTFYNEHLNKKYLQELNELHKAEKARQNGFPIDSIVFDTNRAEEFRLRNILYGSKEHLEIIEARVNIQEEIESIQKIRIQKGDELTRILEEARKIDDLKKDRIAKLQEKNIEIENLKNENYIPAPQPEPEIENDDTPIDNYEDEIVPEKKEEKVFLPFQQKKTELSGADLINQKFDTFSLGGDIGRFFGKLERKKLAIALTGDSGAGKTYFSYAIAKAFVDYGMRVKYFSLEEGVGHLAQEKVKKYGLHSDHFKLTEEGDLNEVREAANSFDVVIVDSYSKISENRNDFENLRTDFPETIFLIIFQQTSSGQMRGGPAMKYNSSIAIDMFATDGSRIARMDKNRYGTQGWEYDTGKGMVVWEGAARRRPKK